MSTRIRRSRGFQLVELIIGSVLVILVLTSSYLALNNLTRAGVSTRTHFNADERLQSVADQIREVSSSNFQTMTELTPIASDARNSSGQVLFTDNTNTVVLNEDKAYKVRVTRSIGPLNPVNMTRRVTLVAKWKVSGIEKEKRLNFDLTRLQSKVGGASLTVRVFDPISGYPIDGVKVVTQADDSDLNKETGCVTGAPGTNGVRTPGVCVLTHVRLVDNLPVFIDGNLQVTKPVAYFHSEPTSGDPYTEVSKPETVSSGLQASFQGTVYLTPSLTPNETGRLLSVPMYKTGTAVGRVVESGTLITTGIEGVVVELRKKPGTLVIDNNKRITAITDASGRFSLPHIVPGFYSLHVIGNQEYVGVAYPNDGNDNAPNLEVLRRLLHVKSASSVQFGNYVSMKRGDYEYQVTGLGGDGSGSFVNGSDPTTGNPALVRIETSRKNVRNESTMVTQDMSNTVPFLDYYNNPAAAGVESRRTPLAVATPNPSGSGSGSPAPSPSGPPVTIGNTFFYQSMVPEVVERTITDSSEQIEAHHAPAILAHNGDPTANLVTQSANVFLRSPQFQIPPFIPVLARKLSGSSLDKTNLQFMAHFTTLWGNQLFNWTDASYFPVGTNWSLFGYSLRPIQAGSIFSSGSTHSLMMMQESALANVTGFIMKDGRAFVPVEFSVAGQLQYSTLYTTRGGVVRNSTIEDGKNFIAQHYVLSTNIKTQNNPSGAEDPFDHEFSFMKTPCVTNLDATSAAMECIGLLPNAGAEETELGYYAWTQPTPFAAPIESFFKGVQRIRDYTKPGYPLVALGDPLSLIPSNQIGIGGAGLPIKTILYWNPAATQTGNVQILAGRPGTSPDYTFSRNSSEAIHFQGSTTLALRPGVTDTANIDVTEAPAHSPLWVVLPDSAITDQTVDWVQWKHYTGYEYESLYMRYSDGKYRQTDNVVVESASPKEFPLLRKVKVKVSGRVVRQNNTNILGLSVKISGYGFDEAQTITDTNGNFTFSPVNAVPIDPTFNPHHLSDDIVVTVTNSNFESNTTKYPLYNAYGAPSDDPYNCADGNGLGTSCMNLNLKVIMTEIGATGDGL